MTRKPARDMLIGIDASRVSDSRQTGTERYSRDIIGALLDVDTRDRFRLYSRDGSAAQFQADNVEVVEVRRPRAWTHIGLARELRRRPPDALFVPAHVLPASFAWSHKHVRSVVMVHDVGFRFFPRAHPLRQRLYLDMTTRFAVRFATRLLALSETTRLDLIRQFGAAPDKVVTALPGTPVLAELSDAEVTQFLRARGLASPYAVFVGTQQPRKNLARLLDAWKILGESAPLLVVAGRRGWGGEDLEARARDLGVAERVKFLGYVGEAEKSALIRAARAVVVPSLYEGFGFPVVEAQSVGVPVACSNTSALPEAAGDAAEFFDPLDAGDMARAIQRVLTDEPARAQLIAGGRRNVARFDWAASARTVLDVLVSVSSV